MVLLVIMPGSQVSMGTVRKTSMHADFIVPKTLTHYRPSPTSHVYFELLLFSPCLPCKQNPFPILPSCKDKRFELNTCSTTYYVILGKLFNLSRTCILESRRIELYLHPLFSLYPWVIYLIFLNNRFSIYKRGLWGQNVYNNGLQRSTVNHT